MHSPVGLALEGLVADRFDVDHLAGTGSMGSVYRAWDRETGKRVAVKVLHPHLSEDERFVREAVTLAQLNHPGIVRFVAHGRLPDGQHYLAMEWLDGESLAQRLERELLTVREAVVLGCGVALALAAAHEAGVIHRDLKPGNIFLVDRSTERIKLVDFGIAYTQQGELTEVGTVLGTPGYMAPEQLESARTVDARTDLYALGAVLFRSLVGYCVFQGDNALEVALRVSTQLPPDLASLRRDVTPQLHALVMALLSRSPSGRPDGAAQVYQWLAAMAASAPPEGRQAIPADGECGLYGWPTPDVAKALGSMGIAVTHPSADAATGVASVAPQLASFSGRLDDAAHRAAHAALAVRRQARSAALGIALGNGQCGPVSAGTVRVDSTVARLLSSAFDIDNLADGCNLIGEVGAATSARLDLTPPPTRRRFPLLLGLAILGTTVVGGGLALTWTASDTPDVASTRHRDDDGERSRDVDGSNSATLDPTDPNTYPCPVDHCEPLEHDDAVDLTSIMPQVRKLARRVVPDPQLVQISATASDAGAIRAKQGQGGSYLFRSTAAKSRSTLVVFTPGRLMARSQNETRMGSVEPPKCGSVAAYRAAHAAGIDGTTVRIEYRAGQPGEPAGGIWLIGDGHRRVILDGKCAVLRQP